MRSPGGSNTIRSLQFHVTHEARHDQRCDGVPAWMVAGMCGQCTAHRRSALAGIGEGLLGSGNSGAARSVPRPVGASSHPAAGVPTARAELRRRARAGECGR